jgi:two-component system, OmpR family, response regulator VicR
VLKTSEQRKPECVSVGYVARHCGVSNATVLRWIEKGQLLAFRLPGGHHRINQNDFTDFLKKHNML